MSFLRASSPIVLAGPDGVQGARTFGSLFDTLKAAEAEAKKEQGITAADVASVFTTAGTVFNAASPLIQTFLPDKYQNTYAQVVANLKPITGGATPQPAPAAVTTQVAPAKSDNTLLYVGLGAVVILVIANMRGGRRR